MVIVYCPAAGTQPTGGNWTGPRAQRNKCQGNGITCICPLMRILVLPSNERLIDRPSLELTKKEFYHGPFFMKTSAASLVRFLLCGRCVVVSALLAMPIP